MDQNTKLIGTGVAGAVLSAIGLTAFIAKLDYLLIPAFVTSVALAIFALMRRRRGCPAKTPQPN
jgi:Membrane transport protein MerF